MSECGCENGGKWSAERMGGGKEDVEEVDVEYKMGRRRRGNFYSHM